MQKPVQCGPINESEINSLGANIVRDALQILPLALRRVAHVVRELANFQKIENVRPAVHAARFERAFLFREIEERNMLEGDVVEVKVTAKFQVDFHEFAQPTPENAPTRDRRRQPTKRA